jgi:hypothetical protein
MLMRKRNSSELKTGVDNFKAKPGKEKAPVVGPGAFWTCFATGLNS